MKHWAKIHALYSVLSECLTSFVSARSFFSGCFQFFLHVCLHCSLRFLAENGRAFSLAGPRNCHAGSRGGGFGGCLSWRSFGLSVDRWI